MSNYPDNFSPEDYDYVEGRSDNEHEIDPNDFPKGSEENPIEFFSEADVEESPFSPKRKFLWPFIYFHGRAVDVVDFWIANNDLSGSPDLVRAEIIDDLPDGRYCGDLYGHEVILYFWKVVTDTKYEQPRGLIVLSHDYQAKASAETKFQGRARYF